MAQDGEMGLLHSLLLTRATPNWGLSRFFKQSLKKAEFSEAHIEILHVLACLGAANEPPSQVAKVKLR